MEGMSRTKTGLRLFTAATGVAVVDRIVRVAIVVAFWPTIAFFAPIDPERATQTVGNPQFAGLVAAGEILVAFMIVEALLITVGFRFVRLGKSEFGPEHSTRITHSGFAMVLYVVLAFVGNITVSVALGSFLPWLGYTLSLNPVRYAAFTLVNVGLALVAGLAVFWMVGRLLDTPAWKWAIAAFALGIGSVLSVMVTGLAFLVVTPLPTRPTEIPFTFAMAEVSGDLLAGISIILWLSVFLRTLDRFRRGELVASPPRSLESIPPPYLPRPPPTPP